MTAAKCLLIGRHTQLYERAIDILKQADDVIGFTSGFIVYVDCTNLRDNLPASEAQMNEESYHSRCHSLSTV